MGLPSETASASDQSQPRVGPPGVAAGARPARQSDLTAALGADDPDRVGKIDLAHAVRVARMFSDDPELRPFLRELLEAWATGPNAELRRRAEILSAYLDGTWAAAARTHAVPEVRTALLENPPDDSAETQELLVQAAESDAMPDARRAALRGLPGSLAKDRVARIAARVNLDGDAGVRVQAMQILGTMRASDRASIDALKLAAFSSQRDGEERESALIALLKCSNANPGVLTAEEDQALTKALDERPQ